MKVLLAITGGIAAYKSPELVRRLRERGHQLRCLLTDNAARLVSAEALATVSGHPVRRSLWDEQQGIEHIDLARWCELLLVAPATANCLAKLALGLADDLLGTLVLALEEDRPLLLAPAMNTVMWHKAVLQQHVASLRARGARIVEPVAGQLACGEEGLGAMAPIADLVAAVDSA